jgi:hypothetical protein
MLEMSLYGTLALICWLGFFALVMRGLVLFYSMVEALDRERAKEDPQYLTKWRSWWFSNTAALTLYRRYHPSGNLLRQYWLTQLAAMVCFALAVICLFRAVK